MSKKNPTKPVTHILGTAFALTLCCSTTANAESNPFSMTELSGGYMLADGHKGKCAEGKCGEGKCGGKKAAEAKCGSGKGVDMQGNVVDMGNFNYGGDTMGKYAGGKIATGKKDPAACGSYSSDKCSVGHLK